MIDAFFVGVGKCGTSWIYEYLRSHPDVDVPAIKEPYLVDIEDQDERDQLEQRLFSSEGSVRCDFSGTYYFDEANPQKLRAHNPAAKVILTVRRPSSRVGSHFAFLKRSGLVSPHIELATYLGSGDDFEVVERCDYRLFLERYSACFPREQLLVLPLEHLASDRDDYAERLTAFLGIATHPIPQELEGPVLPRSRARSFLAARAASSASVALRRLGALRLLGRLKSTPWLHSVLYVQDEKREPSSFGTADERIVELDLSYDVVLEDWVR